MTGINEGRWASRAPDDTVVFMIGMRVNKLRAVREWLPVFATMPKMIRELENDPELGLLSSRYLLDPPRGATLIQYWRSAEHLRRFAADPEHTHRPAWTAFFRAAYQGRVVGVWHETYVLGTHENVYVNMPDFGLGTAFAPQPVSELGNRAADRIRRTADRTVSA